MLLKCMAMAIKSVFDCISFDFNSLIGRELGNVTILKELGHGNRGVVYLGFQKSLKRQVAVKILPKMLSTAQEDKDRFLDEAEIVAGLSHPNIIPIFEMGENDDFYFQVMQLVVGDDLNKIIKKRQLHPIPSKKILPIEETIDIIIKVLDGLGYAHGEGIIHQDIKPANILLEEKTGRPLIADFGIAKTVQVGRVSPIDVVIGSPVYISPEQACAENTDGRTDIYSVGVTLLKMLCGVLPRRNENVAQILVRKINEPDTFFTQKPSECSPVIDDELEKIIFKSIEVDKRNRYQTAQLFKDDLLHYQKNTVVKRLP